MEQASNPYRASGFKSSAVVLHVGPSFVPCPSLILRRGLSEAGALHVHGVDFVPSSRGVHAVVSVCAPRKLLVGSPTRRTHELAT